MAEHFLAVRGDWDTPDDFVSDVVAHLFELRHGKYAGFDDLEAFQRFLTLCGQHLEHWYWGVEPVPGCSLCLASDLEPAG